MHQKGLVSAQHGLRLRDSPRDGLTVRVLAPNSAVQILGRETWLRVQTEDGQLGFVHADYIEPLTVAQPPAGEIVEIVHYQPSTGRLRGEPIRVDRDFIPALALIEEQADKAGIDLWVTSSLREPYQPVAGSVVTPARFSNHHIGHAIDINVILDGEWFNSARLGNIASLPGAIQQFFSAMPELGLRWGGTFGDPDPVHIDDNFNHDQESSFRKKILALWGDSDLARTA